MIIFLQKKKLSNVRMIVDPNKGLFERRFVGLLKEYAISVTPDFCARTHLGVGKNSIGIYTDYFLLSVL